MPVHTASSGDWGLLLYNGGGTPIGFREAYIYDGGWIQLAELWHCTVANPGTGTYTWQKFCVFDKYAPTVTPTSFSTTQARALAPIHFNYVDQSPAGVGYSLVFVAQNFTQGTTNTVVTTLAYGRASSGFYSWAVPSGWNANGQLVRRWPDYQWRRDD